MKTNKLNGKNFTNSAIMVLGLTSGVALSGALGNLVEATMPEYEEFGKAGIAGAGLLGGTMIKPSDELGKGLQALSLGVAAKQIYDLATDAVKGSITVKPVEERTTTDKMLYGAIGLGCPNDEKPMTYLAAPSMNFNPTLDVEWEEEKPSTNQMGILA